MKVIRFFAISVISLFLVGTLPLTSYADPPIGIQACPWNPPHQPDDDGDGQADEDPVDGVDNDGDGKIDEDPWLPMCEWRACIDLGEGGVSCASYTLKYFRNFDLLTTNTNIKRAVIVVHGRRNRRETVDHRPIDYYDHIHNAAIDLGLQNETLIIAPFFGPAKKCPVDSSNECIEGAPNVETPWWQDTR